MKINFVGNKISLKLKNLIKVAVKITLEDVSQDHKNIELSIAFISSEDMQELNKRTRGIDSVTDVLSYPNFSIKAFENIDTKEKSNYIGKNIFLGDMAICLKRAQEQAIEYEHSLEAEVIKLVIHSTLHMMGFDHIKDDDYTVMQKEEEKIASKFYTFKKI